MYLLIKVNHNNKQVYGSLFKIKCKTCELNWSVSMDTK